MKVALVKAPATYADWYRRPVLGLGYICGYLKANDIDCRIFDAYFHSWSEDELLRRVKAYGPDIVGLTAMTHEIVETSRIASRLRSESHVPLVIGGCHVTALPGRTLEEFPAFDYGVCGEGEQAFLDLVHHLEGTAKSDLESIKGLVFRRDGRITVNERPPFLSSDQLDKLPHPDFEDYYDENPEALKAKDGCYVITTSRGCPYNCAFCMQVLGRKVRRRSAEDVVAEMEEAIRRWGAHTFDFYDEIILLGGEPAERLLNLMIARGIPERARWCGQTRANLVTPELMALAKRAGCFRLGIEVESGDDKILRAIGKGITVDEVRSAVKIMKGAGISVDAYFILGHPNETEVEVTKTVELAAELNPDTIAVGIMVPYPGTRIFEMARRGEGGYRLISEDWSQYDKYGGKALELEGLPYEKLVGWQRKALINFYLKNFRLLDFLRYIWRRRRGLLFLLKKRLGLRLVTKEPFTG